MGKWLFIVSILLSFAWPTDAVTLRRVATGLDFPLYLTAPSNDSRLFIVERAGRIRIIENGTLLSRPFLNISDRILSGGEQGLLSMAFHPRYATNGYFYVNYTDLRGDTRIVRFQVSKNRNVARKASAKIILTIDQPFTNHNGGHIQFGPDGMLYIAMGDGGSGGDPFSHAQNKSTLLGDLLRIDVDQGDPYSIPANNPYRSQGNFRPEIWASGLRNPWRFAFDRPTNRIYIADVGQSDREEINIQPATRAGINYGWNIMEGKQCYRSNSCNRTGLSSPVLDYSHSEGCSVTGGYVYRGRSIPSIRGHYFYADFCAGWIRSFRYVRGQIRDSRTWNSGVSGNITSFGLDSSRELYVLYADGNVYKFVP